MDKLSENLNNITIDKVILKTQLKDMAETVIRDSPLLPKTSDTVSGTSSLVENTSEYKCNIIRVVDFSHFSILTRVREI